MLLADLPGVAPEDIELEVNDGELRFCGLRWSTGFVRHGRRLISERRCGRFCRTFSLDEPVDVDRVEQGHDMGLRHASYNIYVAGLSGTGKKETIRRELARRGAAESVPPDWIYVNHAPKG